MAFSPHYRLTFGGTLSEGDSGPIDEIWQCNVSLLPYGGGTLDEDLYMEQIDPTIRAWFSDTASGMSNAAVLNFLKCNEIGADGRYTSRTTSHRRDLTPTGGAVTPQNPEIISCCLSWITGVARGPGSKGRIYPPNPTYGSRSSMLIASSEQGAAAAAGVKLLQVLNNANDGPFRPTPLGHYEDARPVVASSVNGSLNGIIGCRAGSVKDVQRRRKDAIRETYVTSVFLSHATS